MPFILFAVEQHPLSTFSRYLLKKKRLPGEGKRDEMSAEVNGKSDAAGRENGPRLEEIDTVQFKREGSRPGETCGRGVSRARRARREGRSPPGSETGTTSSSAATAAAAACKRHKAKPHKKPHAGTGV